MREGCGVKAVRKCRKDNRIKSGEGIKEDGRKREGE